MFLFNFHKFLLEDDDDSNDKENDDIENLIVAPDGVIVVLLACTIANQPTPRSQFHVPTRIDCWDRHVNNLMLESPQAFHKCTG